MAAGWITTKQANNHADRRLVQQLEHEREMERKKLVHSSMYELYEQATIVAMNFMIFIPEIGTKKHANMVSLTEFMRELGRETDKIIDLIPRVMLVASPKVASSYNAFQVAALEFSSYVLSQIDFDKDPESIRTGVPKSAANLLRELCRTSIKDMRESLGVSESLAEDLERQAAETGYRWKSAKRKSEDKAAHPM
ncbi:hypothetical protein GCM10017786_57130 [Amycolatopsis deserti]|uniref:Uncharacterized protein n=2 Tax=Amycolatopsis deserti TaxID=185696 RepID=A0ABQ3JG13_9PSEU|nr:hypothetical protein GCM10017786_57130 [Amycolatopsis deserti]